MRTRRAPLLAELHAHTTWSDGVLSVRELVDLVGVRGFDVLCVTDHVVRSDDPWLDEAVGGTGISSARFDDYLAEIRSEAARAKALYDLLVIPGLELTFNDPDPEQGAHAVSIGVHDHVAVDDGIEPAILAARSAGAAILAAHPYGPGAIPIGSRVTKRWAVDGALRDLAHRFELFNRGQLFGWVAEEHLHCVATGDVHRPAHVTGWKTLIPCAKDEQAVVEYLRSPRPVYLARVEDGRGRLAA